MTGTLTNPMMMTSATCTAQTRMHLDVIDEEEQLELQLGGDLLGIVWPLQATGLLA